MGELTRLVVVVIAGCAVAGSGGCASRDPSRHADTIRADPAILAAAGAHEIPHTTAPAPKPIAEDRDAGDTIQLVSSEEPLPEPEPTTESEPESLVALPAAVPESVPAGPLVFETDLPVREVTLANILTSVAGRNPEVGFATQRYAEAYARLIAARTLCLPSINAGLGWNNHPVPLQASNGTVGEASRS